MPANLQIALCTVPDEKTAGQLLLLIKTSEPAWPLLEARILELHPYELPEIIAVPIQTGQTDYIKWITNNLITP